jgi:Zn finger protein HypA/HybF involved in hydrogenase expression
MNMMVKKIAYKIECPHCKLISYTTASEVYGPCPYCCSEIHWRVPEERAIGLMMREAV